MPDFEYAAPGTACVLGHYTASIAVLLLWTGVAVTFMVRSATLARAD
jgi:hypothetical protein